jgi:alkylation response protein AidB-like acyl-CoA dehydrogenase
MGLSGFAIDERFGGVGLHPVELSIVAEELGRGLIPSPFLGSSVLAASLLGELGDDVVSSEILPLIVDGSAVVTLAISDQEHGVEARTVNESWVLRGSVDRVLDGDAADYVIVVVREQADTRAFIVKGTDPALGKQPLSGLDATRRHANLVFNDVAVQELQGSDPQVAVQRCLDLGALAVAAEQLGVLRACLDRTVSYVKERVQFGRPVGSFQAVKHGCAAMWVRYELAESAVRHAAATAGSHSNEESVAATMALAYCSEALVETASDMIQYHGGIAYTWEHDAHLYYRRAHSSSVLLGRPAEHKARLAGLLGL